MTQYCRPLSDTLVGSWTPYPSTPTTLYDKTDEVTIDNDTTYINADETALTCVLKLSGVSDPGVGTGHVLHIFFRSSGTASPEKIDIRFIEDYGGVGENVLFTLGNQSNRSGSYADINSGVGFPLTEGQANQITDYSNLFVEIAMDGVNGGEWLRVTQVYLEVPSPASQTLIPSGVGSLEVFGTTFVNVQQTLIPLGVVSLEGFGTAFMNAQQTLISSGIGSLESFGTSFLNVQQTLNPGGIPSLEAFGSGALNFYLFLSAIGSEEVFGTHEVVFSTQSLIPGGITSLEVFGNGRLNFYLFPSPVISQEGFGSSKLGFRIFPVSVISEEGFGTLLVNLQQTLLPSGIASLEAFDIPSLSLIILSEGVVSAVSFGNTLFKLEILPSGIVSAEAFGILRPSFPAPRYHNVIPRERIFKAKARRRKDGTANLL